MISSLLWVPKGAARQHPVRFELSADEYARVQELAKEEAAIAAAADKAELPVSGATFAAANSDDEDSEGENQMATEDVDMSDLPPELRMDEYDNEEDGLADEYDNDPYEIVENGDAALALNDEDDDEDEDNEVKPTDSVLVVALTEDDHSHLEVQLLAEDGSMFVHHDITLPDFPICLAWMDCPPFRADGGQDTVGNYIAVGSFQPAIEIWNLDVLDPLEPSAVLGGLAPGKKKSKKGGKESYVAGSHTDAVMGLSWNKNFRQALASSSADTTVKIWDVTTQACSHTFTHHKDKAQSVLWHYSQGWLLASGSFDKSVALLDCRSGSTAGKYAIQSDIEALAWDPYCEHHLYCAMEDGFISCFDVRFGHSHAFQFQAHGATVSSLSFCSTVPGLLATSSVDKTVRIWDVRNVHNASAVASGSHSLEAYAVSIPSQIAYKSMAVGKLFTLQFHGDDAFVLATGGDKGMVAVWEADENETIKNHFTVAAIEEGSETEMTDAAEETEAVISSSSSASNSAAPFAIGCYSSMTKPAAVDDSWMNAPCRPAHANQKTDTKMKGKKGKK